MISDASLLKDVLKIKLQKMFTDTLRERGNYHCLKEGC